MIDRIAPPTLRLTDRRTLHRHLLRLGDADPAVRAEAALNASDLLARKGVPWSALVPIESEAEAATADWPDQALRLLDDPRLLADELAYLHKVKAWRSPGTDCLKRLEAIRSNLESR